MGQSKLLVEVLKLAVIAAVVRAEVAELALVDVEVLLVLFEILKNTTHWKYDTAIAAGYLNLSTSEVHQSKIAAL